MWSATARRDRRIKKSKEKNRGWEKKIASRRGGDWEGIAERTPWNKIDMLADTEKAERRWMVMCRRAVLQCCLLKDFYFLPFSTWKKSRILSRTRGNSIFLSFHFVFFLKTGSNEAILVCYVTGAPERKDSRLRLGTLTRPSRLCLLTWLKWARFREADRKWSPTGHPACSLHLTGLIRDENRDRRGRTEIQVTVNSFSVNEPVCVCEMRQVYTSWC